MARMKIPIIEKEVINFNKYFLLLYRTVLVYSGIFTFLVDAYPSYAASALAANSFTRSTFAGVFPLFGTQSESRPQNKCSRL